MEWYLMQQADTEPEDLRYMSYQTVMEEEIR